MNPLKSGGSYRKNGCLFVYLLIFELARILHSSSILSWQYFWVPRQIKVYSTMALVGCSEWEILDLTLERALSGSVVRRY